MARMTRKELLKDDQFIEQAKDFSQWLEENWQMAAKWAAIVFVALLLILAGASWMLRQDERKRAELAEAIASYEQLASAGFADEGAVAELAGTLEGMAGAGATGQVAHYYRGSLLHRLGRSDEALGELEKVAGTGSESTIVASAQGLMASIWVETGRTDEAVAFFSAVADGTKTGYPVDQALLALGRLHKEKGDKAEARRALQRLLDEFPASGAVGESNQLLADL